MPTFNVGWDFRATSGFVTDNTPYTYDLGEQYPITRGGATFGWNVNNTANSRDRNAAGDPRLAGIGFCNDTTTTWRVDLPASGTYRINMAVGDFSGSTNILDFGIYDGLTQLIRITGDTQSANEYFDATNVKWTAAQWPGSNVSVDVTFNTSTLTIRGNAASPHSIMLASLQVQLLAATIGPQPLAEGGLIYLAPGGGWW